MINLEMPMLPQDKANHAIYGAGLALIAAVVGSHAFGLPGAPVALGVAALAGAVKEASDYLANRLSGVHLHDVEFLDFLATTCGGAVVAASTLLA